MSLARFAPKHEITSFPGPTDGGISAALSGAEDPPINSESIEPTEGRLIVCCFLSAL